MLIGVVASLAAALCWTLSSGLWRRVPTSLSALQLNLLKNLIGAVTLLPALLLPGALHGVPAAVVAALMLSGVLGIALGDSFYFAALRRLGTRRSLTLDAGGPALSALLAQLTLSEDLLPLQWLAIALISLAVVITARQAPPADGACQEQGLGLLCIAMALLCGLGGALLSRWALRESLLPPLQAAALRLLAALLVMLPWVRLPRAQQPQPAQPRWPLVVVATLLGTSLGIVLQQASLQALPAGLAVALMATAPLMALPLSRLEGDHPGRSGVAAAGLGFAGVLLLLAAAPG
jgi:DME family drug/metabolite transporter